MLAEKKELESLFSSGIFVVDEEEEGRMTCLGLGGAILSACSTSRGTGVLFSPAAFQACS